MASLKVFGILFLNFTNISIASLLLTANGVINVIQKLEFQRTGEVNNVFVCVF